MAWEINTAVGAKIDFASRRNATQAIRKLSLTAAEQALENMTLSLAAAPPFLRPKGWGIDAIKPGDTRRTTDREGTTPTELSHSAELLAHNRWGGTGAMAELRIAVAQVEAAEIARLFGIRRPSASARAGIEMTQ